LLHQHQTKEKMKATTIILAALFTLQVSFLFAGNESTSFNSAPAGSSLDLTLLVPMTPAEATFEEVIPVVIDLDALTPVVPVEAEFEEMVPVIDLGSLVPETPAEADFSDMADQMINIRSLAPATPLAADFE
jgi:hypothetical protein